MFAKRSFWALSLSAVLAACGGGGGGETPNKNINQVTNTAPKANAGSSQNVFINSNVSLDGRSSSDPEGDAITYSWKLEKKPTGSLAGLTEETSGQPKFIPDVAGTYIISLIVNDGKLSSEPVQVSINATEAALVTQTGIQIAPSNNNLQYGNSEKIAVYATYSDGSKIEITNGLDWKSQTAACSFYNLDLNWAPYSINTTVAYNPAGEYQYYKDLFISQRDLARGGDYQALSTLRSNAINFLKRSRTMYASSQYWGQDLGLVIGALDESSAPELKKIENIVNNSCALGRWRQFVFELGVDDMVPINAYQAAMTEYQKVLSDARNGSIEGAWRFFGVASKLNILVGKIGGAAQIQFASNLVPDTQSVNDYQRAPSSVEVDEQTNQAKAVMLDNAKLTVSYNGFSADILISVTK